MHRTVPTRLVVLLAAAAFGCLHAGVPDEGEGSSSTGEAESCGDGLCDGDEDSAICPEDCEPEPPAMCGNGKVEEVEDCDDMSGDVADCDADCTQVVCGDGHINAAAGEQCDDGPDNSDEYQPEIRCTTTCTGFAPHCGDGTCQTDDETSASCPADCMTACGNGVVERDEQCDDGVDGTPTDSADCNSTCSAAGCGDGYTNMAAGEQCDDGNLADDDDCVGTCDPARCGDGHVWTGMEECDDGNDVDDDDCSDACAAPRRVFVSSQAFKGDLLPAVGEAKGVALGDAHCEQLADAARLPGSYRAWLSSAEARPGTSLDDTFTGVYRLVDGTVVAIGWADLTDGTLAHAIDVDEKGAAATSENVWTGTGPDGTLAGPHCLGWTSSKVTDLGKTGITDATDATWTSVVDVPCSLAARIYCVEQP